MEKCALCQLNDANDTGSHVVPHFLLKRIFNVENAKGRDQELSFILTAYDVQSHFGRSVSPDKLEEVFGELSAEELEQKAMDELKVDHLWCSPCEKKFADLESAYAKTLSKSDTKIYQSTPEGPLAYLFWMSVFWRITAGQKLGFGLKAKHQEFLRKILADYDPISDFNALEQKHPYIFDQVSYRLFRCPGYTDKRASYLFMGHQSQPYSLLVDEFVIFLYLKKKHLSDSNQLFFGTEKISGSPVNTLADGENILPISLKDFGKIMDNVALFIKDVKFKGYGYALDKLYGKLGFKGHFPIAIKKEIILAMAEDEQKLGRKYTAKDFTEKTIAVLRKYFTFAD